MSVSNIGGIVNVVQGMIGLNPTGMGGFAGANARQNQGIAMAPDMIRDILARTDLSSALAAKVYLPVANSTSVNAISAATTGQLVAVIVDNNEASAAAFVQVFNTAAASVTLGTTTELYDLRVPAGQMQAFLFADPPAFGTAIAWDATTGPHGATRSTAAKVTVGAVFVV